MIRRARPLLGCLVEIGAYESNTIVASRVSTQKAIEQAFDAIQEIQLLLSFHDANSELSTLNRAPGKWHTLQHHSLRVLRLARALSIRTNNAFNPCVGGELVNKNILPRHVKHDFVARGEGADIQLSGGCVRLTRPVLVCLDGIAKGYAVDLAVKRLKSCSVEHGWVNAGGDLRVFGEHSLAVHQRTVSGFSPATTIKNLSLASSHLGTYPDKTFPAMLVGAISKNQQVISVSASSAWKADALTKVMACTAVKNRGPLADTFNAKMLRF